MTPFIFDAVYRERDAVTVQYMTIDTDALATVLRHDWLPLLRAMSLTNVTEATPENLARIYNVSTLKKGAEMTAFFDKQAAELGLATPVVAFRTRDVMPQAYRVSTDADGMFSVETRWVMDAPAVKSDIRLIFSTSDQPKMRTTAMLTAEAGNVKMEFMLTPSLVDGGQSTLIWNCESLSKIPPFKVGLYDAEHSLKWGHDVNRMATLHLKVERKTRGGGLDKKQHPLPLTCNVDTNIFSMAINSAKFTAMEETLNDRGLHDRIWDDILAMAPLERAVRPVLSLPAPEEKLKTPAARPSLTLVPRG